MRNFFSFARLRIPELDRLLSQLLVQFGAAVPGWLSRAGSHPAPSMGLLFQVLRQQRLFTQLGANDSAEHDHQGSETFAPMPAQRSSEPTEFL